MMLDVQRRLMIDSVPALIAYIDRDIRYVLVNETCRSWFGREPESLQGVLIAEVIGEELTLRLGPFMDRALLGERQHFEAEFPDGQGGIRLVELDYTPDQPDEAGVVPGFVVMANDISERKRLERSLRAGEERWRRLFDGMAEGFFLAEMIREPVDGRFVDFRFLELNQAFETLTGFSVAETVGKTVRQIHPEIDEGLIRIYAQVVETGLSERFEVELKEMDGRWFEGTARHIKGPKFSVIFNDVTARKLAEQELRDRERKQSALVTLGDRLRDLKTVGAITSTAMELLGTTLVATRAGYGRFEADQDHLMIENNCFRTSGRLAGRQIPTPRLWPDRPAPPRRRDGRHRRRRDRPDHRRRLGSLAPLGDRGRDQRSHHRGGAVVGLVLPPLRRPQGLDQGRP